eukprot:TRINITY_DN681_c0_g1_i1.p1 TRINITY_DN681_c0_g1~~TRINITY_DN681_c0_g1_i1.p1  ORF type:complete len:192 (+),score=48.10 TRINITY_DN681_c0_g1_i1:34-576(+)
MGMLFSKVWSLLWSNKEYKVIVIGLDNAGKTTTLYKLLLNEVVVTAPTIGSNVEEITYKNLRFLMWDVGGQQATRSTWSTYYTNANAIILVIDSTDTERIPIVKEELQNILESEELVNPAILIFANKQDLKDAMSASDVSEALSLHDIKDHSWHIQASCALTGEGLYSGMDWLAQKCLEN